MMYPSAYAAYMEQFSDNYHCEFFHKRNLLGKICKVPVTESLSIVHAFSQQYYGNDGKKFVQFQMASDYWAYLNRNDREERQHLCFTKITDVDGFSYYRIIIFKLMILIG